MKIFILLLILSTASLLTLAQESPVELKQDLSLQYIPQDYINFEKSYFHGGKNGGGLEVEIRIIAKKIVSFVTSTKGQKIFPEVNTQHLKRVLKATQFSVTREKLIDRFRTERTCLADPLKMTIECNLNLWGMIKDPRVYYVLIFHEVLGLMNVELGYSRDVSKYPISSKLIDHIDDVHNSNYSVNTLTPEFYSIDSQSLGAILINKKTKESIRIICYDKVELHQCENFAFVRKSLKKKKQAPMLMGLEPLKYEDLMTIQKSLYNLSDNAYVKGRILRLVELTGSLININRSFGLMDEEVVIKKENDFEQIESLISSELQKIKINRMGRKND